MQLHTHSLALHTTTCTVHLLLTLYHRHIATLHTSPLSLLQALHSCLSVHPTRHPLTCTSFMQLIPTATSTLVNLPRSLHSGFKIRSDGLFANEKKKCWKNIITLRKITGNSCCFTWSLTRSSRSCLAFFRTATSSSDLPVKLRSSSCLFKAVSFSSFSSNSSFNVWNRKEMV